MDEIKGTITIKFESDVTRTGKSLLARCLFKELKDLGYEVEYDFTAETKARCTIRNMEQQYIKSPSTLKFKDCTNPRAKIVIIPE